MASLNPPSEDLLTVGEPVASQGERQEPPATARASKLAASAEEFQELFFAMCEKLGMSKSTNSTSLPSNGQDARQGTAEEGASRAYNEAGNGLCNANSRGVTSIKAWMKGGASAWASKFVSHFTEYQDIQRDHDALEDLFIAFERWAEEEPIPKEAQFRVFLSYFPEDDKRNLQRTYFEAHKTEDYEKLRDHILELTGLGVQLITILTGYITLLLRLS